MDEILHVKLGISTKLLPLGHYPKSYFQLYLLIYMYQYCYPLGSASASYHLFCCIVQDRFIYRVGTEVTVSVLFSQARKKC